MLKLEELAWETSQRYKRKILTKEEREAAENLFRDWRDRYISVLARNIRLRHSVRVTGYSSLPSLKDLPLADWSNAAIHVLTIPSEAIQDWFLRASSIEKNKIVAAVLKDGGIKNPSGTFIELPPL